MYIKEVKNKKIWKNSENKKKIIKMKKKKKFCENFFKFQNYSKFPSTTPSFSWSSSYDDPISSPLALSN